MCGVTALLLGDTKATTAAVDLHESLYLLQHRGQDAAGITVCQGGRVYQCKGNGMAAKVFVEGRSIQQLPGYMGLGHLRYPTMGTSSASEAQPFYVNSPFGISMSVNGNLVNTEYLRKFLDEEALRHVNSDSDSELLLNIFAHGLQKLGKTRANSDDIFTALDYFMASESVALKQLGFSDIVDVLPGQAVFCEKGGAPKFRQIVERKSYTPDCFEYVYFARPDSCIDGISVYRSRQNMGEKLAKKIRDTLGEKGIEDIDAVIPVPETSSIAAATLANKLGKPYVTALIKNRYVHRTFILPNQTLRQKSVRRKLSPIESEFRGKNLVIVDDSLVRGTTSREIYGIDLADPVDLVAHGKTRQEIAKYIGADDVIFQDLDGKDGLKAACIEAAESTSQVEDFEVGVFCGKYVTEVPEGYFEHLSELRSGKPKRKAGVTNVKAGGDEGSVISSSGPVNGPPDGNEPDALRNTNGIKIPEHQEDISLYNIASELTVHRR
ncbi:hypothetical protein DL767_011281 [Monosporascus sp. MG133]|nr:hypothetical protein DL767_011281 [Monosporascus sp. MG133]